MALTTTKREPDSHRGTTAGLRFTLICVVSLVLMVLDHQNQHLVKIREVLSVVVYPAQALINWVEDDLIAGDPWLVRDGGVRPPELPGLGVDLDREALAHYTVPD